MTDKTDAPSQPQGSALQYTTEELRGLARQWTKAMWNAELWKQYAQVLLGSNEFLFVD